jgi:hypothetical protein
MHVLLILALAVAAWPLSRLPAGPLGDAIAPVPELAFLLQTTAVCAALGSAVALRAKRRNPEADTWAITTAWAALGFTSGVLAILITLAA